MTVVPGPRTGFGLGRVDKIRPWSLFVVCIGHSGTVDVHRLHYCCCQYNMLKRALSFSTRCAGSHLDSLRTSLHTMSEYTHISVLEHTTDDFQVIFYCMKLTCFDLTGFSRKKCNGIQSALEWFAFLNSSEYLILCSTKQREMIQELFQLW